MININSDIRSILIRYVSILLVIFISLNNIFFMFLQKIFLLVCYFFLLPFTSVNLINDKLILPGNVEYLIIQACIAPSAYILLSLLFFGIRQDFKLLIKLFLQASLYFTIFNLIRIILLMIINTVYGHEMFELLHLFFYEGLSGVGVGLICIYLLRKNNLRKQKPIIGDIIYLVKSIFKK